MGEWWERKRRRGNKISGAEDECILAKMNQRKREEKVGEEEKINPVFLFLFYQVLLTDVYTLYWTFVARLKEGFPLR
jgi:hypothetical protein